VTSRVSEQFHLAWLVMSNYSHHIHIFIFLLYHMICPYISGCYIDISYQYCIFMINKCSCLNADVNCTISCLSMHMEINHCYFLFEYNH
jgi:hypothetical protein